tara:strand:+ start:3574 stop:5460 length:1887 start_codon:yes stop_codon:yes gene_type:complete
MALPRVNTAQGPSGASVAQAKKQQKMSIDLAVHDNQLLTGIQGFLSSMNDTLTKMFEIQKRTLEEMLEQQMLALGKNQAKGRDTDVDGDDVPDGDIAKLSGLQKNIIRILGTLGALGAAFAGFRGFLNPLKNGQLAIRLLRAIYMTPIRMFRGILRQINRIPWVNRLTTAIRSRINGIINFFFQGRRNAQTGRFQRLGLVPRVIARIRSIINSIFDRFPKISIGGLRGKDGAFAKIGGFFRRVLSPIRAVGTFIANSKIFNNPLVKGGTALFKTVFKKILWPLGILISAYEGIKQMFDSDEETIFGKFVDGITTAIGDFFGAPLDMLKNGLAWLLRKAFGVELGEDGRVKAEEGVIGKIIQGIMDFSFEDLIKGLLKWPFDLVKGAVLWIKQWFTGEEGEDPFKSFKNNPVIEIFSSIIGFMDLVKDWVIEQIKKVPFVGKLFKSDEEKLLAEIEDKKASVDALQRNATTQKDLLDAEEKKIKELKDMIASGEFDESWFGIGIGINSAEEAMKNIKKIEKRKAFLLSQQQTTTDNIDALKEEMAEIEEALRLKKDLLALEGTPTASGNGAGAMVLPGHPIYGTSSGDIALDNSNNSQTTINASETITGGMVVHPRGYTNYLEGRFAGP